MNIKSYFIAILMISPVFALAQLSATGPFTGQLSESFESFNNYIHGGISDTLTVFGGEGQFSSYPTGTNQLYIVSPSNGASWGLGGNGMLNSVPDGVNGLGMEAIGRPHTAWKPADVTLTFATAVTSFGGYFASDNTNPHFYLNFLIQVATCSKL